jgi:hypothetical protein
MRYEVLYEIVKALPIFCLPIWCIAGMVCVRDMLDDALDEDVDTEELFRLKYLWRVFFCGPMLWLIVVVSLIASNFERVAKKYVNSRYKCLNCRDHKKVRRIKVFDKDTGIKEYENTSINGVGVYVNSQGRVMEILVGDTKK